MVQDRCCRRHGWSHQRHIIRTTIIAFLVVSPASIAASKASSKTTVIDLSYHHHIKADVLGPAIRQHLWQTTTTTTSAVVPINNQHQLLLPQHSEDQHVRIDLSNSLLGDDGLKSLVDSLLPTTTTTTTTTTTATATTSNAIQNGNVVPNGANVVIHLALRMNQLTQVGVTKLLQTILMGPISSKAQAVLPPQQQEQEQQEQQPAVNEEIPSPSTPSSTTEATTTTTTETTESIEAVNEATTETTTIDTTSASVTPDQREKETSSNDERTSLQQPGWTVESLDLSWNDLSTGEKTFQRALNQLLADKLRCPRILRLDLCGLGPAACRSIGKGLIQRFEEKTPKESDSTTLDIDPKATPPSLPKFVSLHLSGNEALSDAGAATLAAAIRTVIIKRIRSKKDCILVLEKLDLSACAIGDPGVEALSLALESHPRCVQTLDLSNNRISDSGVSALGRALLSSPRSGQASSTSAITATTIIGLDELNLSNNVDIGDRGASILADCLAKGMIKNVVLRSCHVRADGGAAFGRALRQLCKNRVSSQDVSVDLSGNALGVLRGKSVNSGKYSASRLKSTAGATTASYMNFLGKKIRAGIKDVVGVDVMGASADHDEDDEDDSGSDKGAKSPDDDVDASEARCGIKALANAFLDDSADDNISKGKIHNKPTRQATLEDDGGSTRRRFHVGLRHCCLDHAAADALAAAVLLAKDEWAVDLVVDVSLNPVLEDEMVSALRGEHDDEYYLREMADRHQDAMAALRQSQQRAKDVAAAVSRRAKRGNVESEWGMPNAQEDETWDSDADYEDEDYDDDEA